MRFFTVPWHCRSSKRRYKRSQSLASVSGSPPSPYIPTQPFPGAMGCKSHGRARWLYQLPAAEPAPATAPDMTKGYYPETAGQEKTRAGRM